MLPKLSVKNDIQAQHYVTVKLNKFGDKKPNDYGGHTYWSNCHVDGIEHMWFMSENIHDNILKAGFSEGKTFCVMKWKNGDKIGYNYLPEGDIQIQNATPMKTTVEMPNGSKVDFDESAEEVVAIKNEMPYEEFKAKYPEPPKDEYQEVNLPGRGASWNNAFSWLLQWYSDRDKGLPSIEEFCVEAMEYAEKIAPYQETFVQKK